MEVDINNGDNLDPNNQEEIASVLNEDIMEVSSANAKSTAYGGSGGTGGAGGSGGAGGAGGQALNITYVDNYSMLTFMYTIILMLINDKNNEKEEITNRLLPLLESIMEEQKIYRQSLLDTLESLKS